MDTEHDWHCELFGCGPDGVVLHPLRGEEPCRFWRWMQFFFFGNVWSKTPVPGKLVLEIIDTRSADGQ